MNKREKLLIIGVVLYAFLIILAMCFIDMHLRKGSMTGEIILYVVIGLLIVAVLASIWVKGDRK